MKWMKLAFTGSGEGKWCLHRLIITHGISVGLPLMGGDADGLNRPQWVKPKSVLPRTMDV
jgi:hypothetical protein